MQKETNIMPRVATFENILKADAEASRGKQLRPEVVAWHADIEHNIIALSEDFLANTYESGLYREGRVFVPQLRIIQIQQVGFPIGSLNSQTSANMDMNEVDQFAKHTLHIHYYIRYMDDIVILHNDLKQLQEWMKQIEAFLYARLKLRCNSKTGIIQLSHGISFVGKRIWPSHILLRKSTVKHMKHSLKHLAQAYATCEVDLSYVKQVMASYFGLLSHCDSYTIRLWIAENIVFKRNEDINDYPELVHLPDIDWLEHFDRQEEDFYDAFLQA